MATFIVLTNTKHESLRTGSHEQVEKEAKASGVLLQRSDEINARRPSSLSRPTRRSSHSHVEKPATRSSFSGEGEHSTLTALVEVQTIDFVLDEENSLGFRIQDLSHDSSQQSAAGLAVSGLAALGQAENKGVQVGWFVIAVDGRAVQSQAELLTKIAAAKFDAQSLGTSCVVKVSFMPPGGEHYPGELSLRLQIARLQSEVQQHAQVSADAVAAFSESKQGYERKVVFLQQKLLEARGSGGPSHESTPRRSGSLPRTILSRGTSPRTSASPRTVNGSDSAETRNALHYKPPSAVAISM